jgi:hypothetical protein
MNRCLLAKWLLKTLYAATFLDINIQEREGYSVIKEIMVPNFGRVSYQLERMCLRVLIYIIGNGNKIRFRLDVWIGNCAFEDGYSMTF